MASEGKDYHNTWKQFSFSAVSSGNLSPKDLTIISVDWGGLKKKKKKLPRDGAGVERGIIFKKICQLDLDFQFISWLEPKLLRRKERAWCEGKHKGSLTASYLWTFPP